MHLSKIAGVRSLAVALAMLLSVFGTQSVKAQDVGQVKVQEQGRCPTCQVSCKKAAHAKHEAAEAQARAEKVQKKAAEHAAHERAEAEQIEQRGAQDAAKYESKSNKILEDAGLLCPANETQSATATEFQSNESGVREKPSEIEPVTPAPAPTVTPEPQAAPAVEPTPPVPISSAPEPKELPKTASPMDLIGLIGLVFFSGGVSRKFFRR